MITLEIIFLTLLHEVFMKNILQYKIMVSLDFVILEDVA